jgi:Tat protein secretion system quality control protein TatD with DNase activity
MTFKNAKDLKLVALAVPLERLMIETDSRIGAPAAPRKNEHRPTCGMWLRIGRQEPSVGTGR